MSEITTTCPACGTAKKCRTDWVGRKIICICGHSVTVTAAGKAAPHVPLIREYGLKKKLLTTTCVAEYLCPNGACSETLTSNEDEIGPLDNCPHCGQPFLLDSEPLKQYRLAEEQDRQARAEAKEAAAIAAREKRELRKAEAEQQRKRKQRRQAEEAKQRQEQRAKESQERQRERAAEKAALAMASANENAKQPKGGSRTRKAFLAIVLIVVLAGAYALTVGTRISANPLQSIANVQLQKKLDRVIDSDYRNAGIEASAYYKDEVLQSTIVFDIQNVGYASRLDVFRVLLDFAEELKDDSFSTVELAYQGDIRFRLDGYYFRTLGRDRHTENPNYMIRTFPEHLQTSYGTQAYPEWSGGIFGVLAKQLEDFNDFHEKWYGHSF